MLVETERMTVPPQARLAPPAARAPGGALDRERAWRALFEEHFGWVARLVFRFGVPPGDVEDVAQTVFIRAYDHIDELKEIENPGGWLRGIVVRVVSEHRRWRRVRRLKAWLLESRAAEESEPPLTPEQAAQSLEAQRIVAEILDRMSGKLRDVLVLCELEECGPLEVAELLGVPVNTVKSRRRLAREEFQRLFAEREKRLARRPKTGRASTESSHD
jgi:RNA polymerase sigma-70 factor (ECF subfamily)